MELRQTEIYQQIEKMEIQELHTLRDELHREVGGNFSQLPEDKLTKLLAITRALRKKAAAPGTGGPKKKAAPKEKATLEDLA